MKIPKEQKSTGTLVALLLVVLGPALCVVWFMNVAMRNERLAVQQTLTDAYHNHLLSLQRQLAVAWKAKQAALKSITNAAPSEMFAAVIRSRLADAAVVYDASGNVLYPSAPRSSGSEQTKDPPEWAQARDLEFQGTNYVAAADIYGRVAQQTLDIHLKARATQSQATCLLKAGQKAKAVQLLAALTEDASLQAAVSDHGALLIPNAQLLLLKLTNDPGDKRFQDAIERLAARLNDYSEPILSANQRRFLMEEVQTLVGENPDGKDAFHRVPEISGEGQAKTRKPLTPTLSPSDGEREKISARANSLPATSSNQSLAFSQSDTASPSQGFSLAPSAGKREMLSASGKGSRSNEHSFSLSPSDGERDGVRGGSLQPTVTISTDQIESTRPFILFPTLDAERLAAEYLETSPVRPMDSIVQSTQLRGVLRMAAAERTIVALFKEDRLRVELMAALNEIALPDVAVTLLTSKERAPETPILRPIEAGDFLPGWRLALAFKNGNPFDAASKKQMRFYLWTGLVMVLVIGVLALAVARNVIAQMKLARLKDDLVSTVSHELKTPLASMRALADTLSAGRYRNAQQLQDYLGLISKENQRLSHLIDNFLAFSRMERGKQRFRLQDLSPETIVDDAVDALKERLLAPPCSFTAKVDPGLPRIRGDADALTTVLINLLDNAYKYTESEKRISLRAYANGRAVYFEVEDNGIGLNRTETKKVFDRFYQADQSLTRKRGGCGLGLSIVQYIVQSHGGTVDVQSVPGKGSTFRVKIPFAEQDGSESKASL